MRSSLVLFSAALAVNAQQGCFNDGDCGSMFFCKQQTQNSAYKICALRAGDGALCDNAVNTPWTAIKCLDYLQCQNQGATSKCVTQQVSNCQTNMDCKTDSFCRQVTAGSELRQCYSKATLGSFCTIPGATAEWQSMQCQDPMECLAIDTQNPQKGGLCKLPNNQGCLNTDMCSKDQFCKRSSPQSSYKRCYARAVLGGMCTPERSVDEWENVACAVGMTCLQLDNNNAKMGGTCVMESRGLLGQTCSQNFDCGADFFCRRRDQYSQIKTCLPRARTGEQCTLAGGVTDWNERLCATALSCEPNDALNPSGGGTCTARSACQLDTDCSANEFCKQLSTDNLQKECVDRAQPGAVCTLDGMVGEWNTIKCVNGFLCKPTDPGNPNLGGQCQRHTGDCVSDDDCGGSAFCKPASSGQSGRKCFARGARDQFCIDSAFAPAWSTVKCMAAFRCVLTHEQHPEAGGTCQDPPKCGHCSSSPEPVCANGKEYLNGCHAQCAGVAKWDTGACNQQGCLGDKDCGSSSLFCKTAMPFSSQRACFVKGSEGDSCTWDPYVMEWEQKKCLDKLYCVLLDATNPPRGGTCQSQATRCESDKDCSSADLYCKRLTRQSPFKSCVTKAVAGEHCTLNNTVVEWDVRPCLDSLYCLPLNFFDSGLGGTCGGSEKCTTCPNYYSPVCGNGQEYQNPCFAQCTGVHQYQMGACPMPAGSGPALNTVQTLSGQSNSIIPGHPYSIYTNNHNSNSGTNGSSAYQNINEVFATNYANDNNYANNYANTYAGMVPSQIVQPPVTVNYTNPNYNPFLPNGYNNNQAVQTVTYTFPSIPLDPLVVTNYDPRNPFANPAVRPPATPNQQYNTQLPQQQQQQRLLSPLQQQNSSSSVSSASSSVSNADNTGQMAMGWNNAAYNTPFSQQQQQQQSNFNSNFQQQQQQQQTNFNPNYSPNSYNPGFNPAAAGYVNQPYPYANQAYNPYNSGYNAAFNYQGPQNAGYNYNYQYNQQQQQYGSNLPSPSSFQTTGLALGTCSGYCGTAGLRGCMCDGACAVRGDCCSDYWQHCSATSYLNSNAGSCRGRCSEAYRPGQQCYCDGSCRLKGDCCADVNVCAGGSFREASSLLAPRFVRATIRG